MKRIILAILCGILFPILYTVLIGILAERVFPQYEGLLTMQVAGRPSMGPICAPIAIPVWIYDGIRFYNYFGFWYIFDTAWFRITWVLGFNFSLYPALFYWLFSYFGLFKRPNPEINSEPPSPPQFSGQEYSGKSGS